MAARNKSGYPCIYFFCSTTTTLIQLTCTRLRETWLNSLEMLDAPIHRHTIMHEVLQNLLSSVKCAFSV